MDTLLKDCKFGFTLIALLLIVLLLCGYSYTEARETIEELEDQNLEYAGIIAEKEERIRILEQRLKTLEQDLKDLEELRQNPLVQKAKEIEKYIDLKNEEDFEKVMEIVATTPLDLKTASIIIGYSNQLNIPSSLLVALIELESNFDPYSKGKNNDRGYCQIIPETEKWLAQNYGHIIGLKYDPSRIYEPEYNIGLGALYLYVLRQSYGDDYHKILSEYNRGPYNLEKYYRKHRTYETAYSRGILARADKYRELERQSQLGVK